MEPTTGTAAGRGETPAYEKRWWSHAVLSMSLIIIVAAVSSLNVTLPSLVRELEATGTELQWIMDAYVLAFGGLLLFFGALGDRYGRKGALQLGMGLFGISTLLAATVAESAAHLIILRVAMGVGAALIMPATLSIITAIFPAEERPRAIAVWAGFVGVGGVLGPVVSGFLLEHFWWGSAFLVNVPLVVLALIGTVLLVPRSRDEQGRGLDPLGGVLSIVSLGAVLFGIIEGPEMGWTSPLVVAAFLLGALATVSFVAWERRVDEPMLVMGWFRQPRFTVSAMTISLMFFAMFGFFFVFTQYLQFARGWSPLTAGLATMPIAVAMLVSAPRGPKLAARIGVRHTLLVGLLVTGAGLLVLSRLTVDTPYIVIAVALLAMGAGNGLSAPSATTGIMSSLPVGQAGVGSAINDTTREAGGAVGIAVLGSVLNTSYRGSVAEDVEAAGLSGPMADRAGEGLGGALEAAGTLPAAAGADLAEAARSAFMGGFGMTLTLGAVLFAAAAVVVHRAFPVAPQAPDGGGSGMPAPAGVGGNGVVPGDGPATGDGRTPGDGPTPRDPDPDPDPEAVS